MSKKAVLGEDVYVSPVQRRRREKKLWLTVIIAIAIAYIVIGGVLWVLLRSPLFRLRSITVQGNATVPTADVIGLVQASFKQNQAKPRFLLLNNILSYPSRLPPQTLGLVPELSDVTIERHYSTHSLVIKVTERQPAGIFCRDTVKLDGTDTTCYWFDRTGVLFQRSAAAEGSLIYVVHDYSGAALGLGARILPSGQITNLLSIFDLLSHTSTAYKQVRINDRSLQEVQVETYNGPSFYFSLRFSAADDAAVLMSLRNLNDFSKLQYVDFRVQNRVYYK